MRKQNATRRTHPKGKRSSKPQEKKIIFPLADVKEQNKLVHSVNMHLQKLVGDINAKLELPDFGSGLYGGTSDSCVFYNADTIVASTISDRIVSKFESPNYGTEKLLRAQCTADWISFERDHISRFEFDSLENVSQVRGVVYRARGLINSWLFDSAKLVNFWSAIESAPIDFGPGESYTPNQGKTSVFSKISAKTIFPNWTVTLDYAVHAAYLIAANKGLRSQAKVFLNKPEYPSELNPDATRDLKNLWFTTPRPRVSRRIEEFAYRVFVEIFCAFPIHHPDCLIKMGSRGSSVYKNRKKRRFIEIQCLLNVIGQKIGGFGIRACLKANAHIDLDDGQQYHRWLISQPNMSTLDESNASDSIVLSTAYEFIGPNTLLSRMIGMTRADLIRLQVPLVTPKGGIDLITQWYPVKKMSSMGNGFTFECLSLILGAISKQFDSKSSVYGDDIVCSSDKAEQISAAICAVGFVVNTKKSFIGKPLKESCGAFYLEGRGYITCFDIKWCLSVSDVIMVANKLGRILRGNPLWDHPLRELIALTHASILSEIPAFLRGPIRNVPDIPLWVEDDRFLKAQKGSNFCKQELSPHWGLLKDLTQRWQLFREGSYPLVHSNEWAICYLPVVKPNVLIRAKHSGLTEGGALMWSYIHSGRVVNMQIRQNKSEQSWAFKPHFVHSSGVFLRAGTARRVCASFDKNAYRKEVIRENLRLSKKSRIRSSCSFKLSSEVWA